MIVGLPNDREVHPAALRWRLEADWVREYAEEDLSLDELLERVDDTMELAEHL